MRVAVYIRVSTHMQVEDGYSLAAQKNRLKAFSFSQDWKIVQHYVDEGKSAKDMERPNLQKMLNGVREGLFDIVLVYKLDRLTRSVIDLDRMLTEFNKHDVMFKSATEIYDTTTATGRLFIRLVASMAQWERENLGERVSFGMNQKAKEGKWVINKQPFGYDKDGDYLMVNQHEAIVVKRIFDLYLTGKYGVGKIAQILNAENIYTKSGFGWNYTTIHYVLTNPLYIGTMRYNYRVNKDQYFEIEGAVPPIIEKEKFERVQVILSERSHSHPKKAVSPYIFTNNLKCARCGASMSGHQSQTIRGDKKYISYQYYCSKRRFKNCDIPNISQNYLEIQFLKLIDGWVVNTDMASEITTSSPSKSDDTIKINKIKTELSTIEKRRKKWQYAWANDMLTDEDLTKRNAEEEEKEKMILVELGAFAGNVKAKINNKLLIETLKDLKDNWNNLNVYEKKQFVNIAVKSMTVDKIKLTRCPESVKITDIEFN